MSSSEFQKRWQSDHYKNYLKVIEALLYLRDGLGPFSQRIISNFQSEILTNKEITAKECKTNTCNAKHIKKGKLEPECPDICSAFLVEILKEHTSCKNPSAVYWANSKICRWSVDAWEIAKVYMGGGQKADNNGPQKSDSAAILQLLSNCKRFSKYTPCGDVYKVIEKRNVAMHSSTLSFAPDQMKETLTMMIGFLKKLLKKLSKEKDIESVKKEIEKTIDKLKELMDTEFEIFLKNNKKSPNEEEIKIFQEIVGNHENRLNSLEELTEKMTEVKAVIPLLEMMQRNPDLLAKLEDGYQNLISLSQLEERTLSLTEKSEATASRVADVEDDLADLRKQVEALALKSPDKNRSQATNHKGQLKNFLDSKKISLPPKYTQGPDPASNNKWLASVTVVWGSETRTFKSPDSCQRIIDAEHSAASVAYQFFIKNEELFADPVVSDKLMTGTDQRDDLEKVLQSFGFAKATYNDCGEKVTGTVKNFRASVTVSVTGIIQKKLDDMNMKQSDRLQAVASEALKAIGQEVTDSAKGTLYGWCGRNKYTLPKYYPESPLGETMSCVHVISSAFGEKQKVEVEGSWCTSKKEAKHSAAELLLKIINETELTGIWRSSCLPNGDSASTAAVKPSSSSDTQNSETKAEEKASEHMKAMPTAYNSSLYCDDLKALCEKLGLDPPEYKVVSTKGNQFQAKLTMEFVFGPDDDKQFKSKAEAENEAAHVALAILRADKTLEPGEKKFKSLLNEFCQKEGVKPPEYDPKGSGTSFHSKVKLKFVESNSEAYQTESEACNFSAKKVLLKLGQSTDHFQILKKYYDESGLEAPKVEYKSRPDGAEGYRAVLDGICIFVSEIPSQNTKDADKNAACRALKVLYPDVDCSDLNRCKNLLQEKTPSVLPKYDPKKLENGKFSGKVTVRFSLEGSSWHSNKEDALNEVAKEFLVKSTSSSG